MKLISLNVEGRMHTDKIFPFLSAESADVVCLQEATESYIAYLEQLGYHTSFVPRCIREDDGNEFIDGLLFAAKVQPTIEVYCYYKPDAPIERESFDHATERNPTPRHIIVGNVHIDGMSHTIGTTHFTWTKDGEVACAAQQEDMGRFIDCVTQLPAHVMCGDFNIPRDYNSLYEKLMSLYIDETPREYTTSLDSQYHRLRTDPLKQELLNRFMVDYVFQTGGYRVQNVRLQFGLSDHAAVVAEVGRG
jgi:endonuclease/exonuclease/phosphatase family metal-dependent hydrolase